MLKKAAPVKKKFAQCINNDNNLLSSSLKGTHVTYIKN